MVKGKRKNSKITTVKNEEKPISPLSKKKAKHKFEGKLSHTTAINTTENSNYYGFQNNKVDRKFSGQGNFSCKRNVLSQANVQCENVMNKKNEKMHDTDGNISHSDLSREAHFSPAQFGKVAENPNSNLICEEKSSYKNCQKRLTEFFPVRRSIRKTNKIVLEERRKSIEDAVLSEREEGLQVRIFEGKGRGVVTTKCFTKGEFVVEYSGELITIDEAKHRELKYAQDENTGCYMYYFRFKNNQYCVDATPETCRLGRLVNHSRNGNLCTKTMEVEGKPHLLLIARENIERGAELTYDYGDRSKESLNNHPWLAQ